MKTKRFLGVLLALTMIIGLLPITAGAAVTPQKITSSNYASLGFSENEWKNFEGYYAIHSIDELEGYRNLININKTAINAVLRQNIDLSSCTWVPISNPYGGIFDGNACVISYMNNGINGYVSDCVGLFGDIENMTVKNVYISKSKIYGNSYMGMIAGRAYYCNILNCYMDTGCYVESNNPQNKTIDPDAVNVGGVVGEAVGSTIKDCVFLGYMKAANTNTTCGLIVGGGGVATNCAYATILKSTCMGIGGIGLSTLKFSIGTLNYHGSTDNDPFAHCFSDITQITSYTCKYMHRTAYTNPKCEEIGYDSRDICMFCGYYKDGTIASTGHNYLKECSEYCDECGAQRENSVSHSYSNDCDEECNVCSETRTTQHSYSTATCTTPQSCLICGATGELDKDNHTKETVNGVYSCCNAYQQPEISDGYYQIENAGQLYWFANHINTVDRTANAVLVADIDLEGKSDGTGRKWTPIGSTGEHSNNFRGHFNGNNHTITNLYIDEQRAGLGLFGEVRLGTVENFTIYGDVKLYGDCSYVGGVIGSAPGANGTDVPDHNGATIRNITSYVNVTLYEGSHGSSYVGGFIGYANHETIIENCSWYGTLDLGAYRADSGVGGLEGRLYDKSNVTIRNCAAYGTIKTSYKSGTHNNYDTIYIGGVLSFSPAGTQAVLENNLWAGEFIDDTDLGNKAHLSAFGTLNGEESVTNCYAIDSAPYLTTENVNANGITTVTAQQFASGEVAYLLGDAFGQTINTDKFPILSDDKVYKYTDSYSNELKFGFADYTEDGAKVNIPTAGEYSLIFADYEGGKLNAFDIVEVTITAEKVGEITKASVKGVNISTDDKIMLCREMAELAPLCDAYIIK